MTSRLHWWWQKARSGFHCLQQKIKQNRVAIGGVTVVLVVVVALIIAGYRFDWTGFNAYSVIWLPKATKGTSLPITNLEEQQPAKTLWDWLQLLIAPAAISLAVAWFTHVQQQRDRRLEQLQHDHDQQLADQRAKSEREATEQHAQTEREIAADNQREASLQAYLNHMIELLLKSRLQSKLQGENEMPGDAEWEVARVTRLRTLILLRDLGGSPKQVDQFCLFL